MLAGYLGIGTDLVQLRRRFHASLKGATLKQVVSACDALGLSARAVRCRLPELARLRLPCLLHWRFNHFVVLESVCRDRVVLHDPARGRVTETLSDVDASFTGVALEVSRSRGFTKTARPRRLGLGGLLTFDGAYSTTFAAGLVLALICEMLLLVTPFYLQLVIDEVLGRADHRLLETLATAFAVLLLFQVAASTMRQLTFQYLAHVTVFDVSARVLHSLLKRPVAWFRSRDLGDIQHRVLSLRSVQTFIVHSAPALAIDTLFIVLIIGLMGSFDPRVTAVAVAAFVAWVAWRMALFPLSLRLSTDIATADSSVQTHFLETLRAAQSVKMLGGEFTREEEWRNRFAESAVARIRAGNLAILDSAVRQLLFQGIRIVVIVMLARRAMAGQMTIGMVSAFVAYLGMFVPRSAAVIERIIEYRLLAVPLDRLADIVFGDDDTNRAGTMRVGTNAPEVDVKSVVFRYAKGEPPLLRGCSLSVPARGFTAIAGPSGAGKSTLLRLIAGMEPASGGDVLIDGSPVTRLDRRSFNSRMATVFEDDSLLKGSVADNIAMFDPDPDPERIRAAAREACIAEEIAAMPMGFETRIGDLGSSLSKGQKQRVLLARALYRRPSLLLLDEATSGLDHALEKRVIARLRRLDVTRIVVTHSDPMLEAADEVLWLCDGTLLSSPPELNVRGSR